MSSSSSGDAEDLSMSEKPQKQQLRPFRNRTTYLSLRALARCCIFGPFLLPWRMALVGTAVIGGATVAKICSFGLTPKSMLRMPLPALSGGQWRTRIRGVAFPFFSRLFLHGMGFHSINVKGAPAAKDKAPIVIGNHQAPWEAIALSSLREFSFVSSDANFMMPVLGNIFLLAQFVSVNRFSEASKVEVEQTIRTRAFEDGWPQVAIFPEGTCSNGTAVLSFRLGAFSPALPVQPVAFKYKFDIDKGEIDPSWTGFEVPLPLLCLRLMCQPLNRLDITFLDPIEPTLEEKIKPTEFARRVRKALAAELNVPRAPHNVDDVVIQIEARRLNIGKNKSGAKAAKKRQTTIAGYIMGRRARDSERHLDDVTLGMAHVRQNHRFSADDVKMAMQRFRSMDTDGQGELTYEKFCVNMTLPPSPLLEEVWFLFAQGKPTLTLKEYIWRCIDMRNRLSDANHILAAFRCIDDDGDGKITFEEWSRVCKGYIAPDATDDQCLRIFRRLDLDHAGTVDMFDFGAAIRERPLVKALFHVLLAKKAPHTPEGKETLEFLESQKDRCAFYPKGL